MATVPALRKASGMDPERPLFFDLVVIGAGPAGASAAFTAAHAGLSVALIDKAGFPRAKLCGGLFSGRARAAFQQVFDRPLDPALFDERRRFAFYLRGARLGPEETASPMHVTMRWDMDSHLKTMACDAGAQDFTGCRVATLDPKARHLSLATGETISWSVLIGADGVQSIVAKALFGRAFDPARIGFALEIEAPNDTDPGPDAPIRIDLDAADWGYGWSFPKRRTTTIGIGGVHVLNPDMAHKMAQYQSLLKDDSRAKVKGHFLPAGEDKGTPGHGTTLLVGDAAGYVDPITGEGIAYAMQSGHAAALAAKAAISQGDAARALPIYRRSVRPIRRSLRLARWLRPLIFSARFRPIFERSFGRSRVLKKEFIRLLNGECEYPRILCLTILRMPGIALRALRSARPESPAPKPSKPGRVATKRLK